MDRQEAIELLKGGPEAIKEWNRRRERGDIIPHLCEANLSRTNMNSAHLWDIDLTGVNLRSSKICGAYLNNSNLRGANLCDAHLCEANLRNVNLRGANLTNALLQSTDLSGADLSGADICGANLLGANLRGATLRGTRVVDTQFGGSTFTGTIIASDFSQAAGLNRANHLGPSIVAVHSLLCFKGKLPKRFLRGCGVREEEIEYFGSYSGRVTRFYTCFISYSTADEDFVTLLHNDLQAAGIRCWKWDHDARTGKSLWGEIDQAITEYDKLILVASKSSLNSPAVMREIERAIVQEDELIRLKEAGKFNGDINMLFPVRLDNYIFEGWEHERKVDVIKKVVADACAWKSDSQAYSRIRDKLIADLKTDAI